VVHFHEEKAMTPEELEEFMRKDSEERIALAMKKNKDYATEDALSNFKRRAELFKLLKLDLIITTPYGVAIGDALLKIDRIINLILKGKDPKNESLDDSWRDLKNYADLAHANWKEANK
jgi:hypothetical protein